MMLHTVLVINFLEKTMSELLKKIRMRTWAEIDLDNIEYNLKSIRDTVGKDVLLCCVVKADGYGHGAPVVSRLFEELSADLLAVSNIEEALQLRENGVTLPILILGYTPAECAETLAKNNITQCVYSFEYGNSLADYAEKCSQQVRIHLKLDTGMGRIGFLCRSGEENELCEALELCKNKNLIPEGIFTHFASADDAEDGEEYTREQYAEFCRAISFFEENGVNFAIRHCANSATTFNYPEYRLDMVRVGLALYGLTPFESTKKALPSLRPAMSLCSVISHVKILKKGESVSYGRKFTAQRDMRVATVPVGYADGLMRSTADSNYTLKIGEKCAPILGRICMDQLLLDVSDIDCKVGDTVTVFDGEEKHTATALANANGTIPYEVLCSVGKRVPRAYVRGSKIIEWNDEIYE